MKTVFIQIGNSDNKLSQAEWHKFVQRIRWAIAESGCDVHFFGGANTWDQWQNVAWAIAIKTEDLSALKIAVSRIRQAYGQDSAAWTEGSTEFV